MHEQTERIELLYYFIVNTEDSFVDTTEDGAVKVASLLQPETKPAA